MSQNRIASLLPQQSVALVAVAGGCRSSFAAVPPGLMAAAPAAMDRMSWIYQLAFDEARRLLARQSLIHTLNYRSN